ncbi:unnamed protein product [Allacma fusca]|uniref:Uncharacterized protein n=1 Tax=Allacma fusca TaxID=39272 RepID=A0A8J2KEV4_9HEXA|nr:unnamed protein product [Allacma fusca]
MVVQMWFLAEDMERSARGFLERLAPPTAAPANPRMEERREDGHETMSYAPASDMSLDICVDILGGELDYWELMGGGR